jgi:hypothetical protein
VSIGSGSGCAVPTLWVHGGVIPPCPSCGAPAEDQTRRPDGLDRAIWFCLICQRGRPPDPGWVDELVPISEDEWRARARVMTARVRARWRASDAEQQR